MHRYGSAIPIIAWLGLGVALTVIFFTAAYIGFERSHNRWLPGYRNIYRLQAALLLPGLQPQFFPYAPGPAKAAIEKDFSQAVAAIVRLYPWPVTVRIGENVFTQTIHLVDDSFFKVFDWPLVEGEQKTALAHMNVAIISQRLARKFFGAQDPLGKTIMVGDGVRKRTLTVTGVMKDWPSNTTDDIKISIISRIKEEDFMDQKWIFNYWLGLNDLIYLKLKSRGSYNILRDSLQSFKYRNVPDNMSSKIDFSLVRLDKIKVWGVSENEKKENLSKHALLVSFALALYAAAAINFLHIHAESAMDERREMAIRIILGAGRAGLFLHFLGRAFMDVGLAMLLLILAIPAGVALLGPGTGEILAVGRFEAWAWSAAGGMGAAVLAALYPLIQLTRLRPAAALPRAGAVVGGTERGIPFVLATGQLFIATAILIFTVVAYRQLTFMEDLKKGFDGDRAVVLHNLDWPEARRKTDLLKRRLRQLPGVTSAALSGTVPPEVGGDLITVTGGPVPPGQKLSLRQATIDPDFLPTYKVALLAGRNFDPARAHDREPDHDEEIRDFSGILNQTAVRQLGLASPRAAIGKVLTIRPGTQREAHVRIIGVVPDLYVEGAYRPVEPTLYSWQNSSMAYLTLRYDGIDYDHLISAAETVWRALLPDTPFMAESLVQRMAQITARDRRQARFLTIYTFLTTLVAVMGLFALALRASRRQKREVGIRRIFGVSDARLLGLLLGRILRPVLWAAVVGLPIAWIVARRWLEGFAYRIDLGPGPFLESFLLVLAVAVVTVSGHLFQLLRIRPVEVLRQE